MSAWVTLERCGWGGDREVLEAFASEAGIDIDEAVSAWVKLRGRGAEPMIELIGGLCRITAVFDSTLDDVVEAFLDASVGESDRLMAIFGLSKEVGR